MEELLKEAMSILGESGGWLSSDIEIEEMDAMIVTVFTILALDAKEESKVPKILESLVDILSKFRTKEANFLIDKVTTDLKNEWMPKISEREVLIL